MEFQTASMDNLAKVITVIIAALGVYFLYYLFTETDSVLWLVPVVLLLSLALSYSMIPRIFMSQGNIEIKNTFVKINIPVQSIKHIGLYEKKFSIRTFGVGGVFGYFGYFNGREVWYVTDRNKKVKIQTENKTYVISPDENEKFISEILKLKNRI